MVRVKIYVEGAGNSKEQKARCREGFSKLLRKVGLSRMPRIVACGGRADAFKDFQIALRARKKLGDFYSLLLVDSEGKVRSLTDKTDDAFAWDHLRSRKQDQWIRPKGAENWQALLMATCMETWILADQGTIKRWYGQRLQENALPSLTNIENRDPKSIQEALKQATKNTTKPYKKGTASFQLLAELDPSQLKEHLSQFRRLINVLEELL